MRYSTRNHNARQPGSVNSRLDFDAATSAAAFVASQRATAARGTSNTYAPSTNTCTTDAVHSSALIPWDCELGRLCDNRDETLLYRLLGYGHIFAHGSGKITPDELSTRCRQLGIQFSKRTFNDWIQRGNRLYWYKRGGYLYLTGWRKLSRKLTKWAAKFHPEWIATNLPGQQRVMLDLTGDAADVRGKLYVGWLASKAAKNGYLDISRWTLCRLWARSRQTLQRYERRYGVRIEARYAEHHDIHSPLVPAHATLHIDLSGREFASWQISNRFFIPQTIEIHPHNGQRHKVRAACKLAVEQFIPVDYKPDGEFRVQRTGRLTFTNRNGKRGFITAYKQIARHLRKHQDSGLRRHYAYMTKRWGKLVYEMTTGDCMRSADMDIDRTAEQSPAFTLRRMQYRIGWADRVGV